MESLQLFMVMVGCRPAGRNTEQHDVFFGIGTHIKDLLPDIYQFWPEAKKKIHLDAWRAVTTVDGYVLTIVAKTIAPATTEQAAPVVKLFFINLGGYKPGEFEEFHYKLLVVAMDKATAIKQAKQTAFYQHTGFKGAPSHIDDKFGVDVDDIFEIKEILPPSVKEKYQVIILPQINGVADRLHLGYMPADKL